MSTITRDTVRKVARLARIRLSEEQVEFYTPKLNNIMKFVEQLNEVNTDNVTPLPSTLDTPLTLRKDVVNDGDCQDAVLSNAPEAVEGFYVVPKVVE